MAIKPLPIPLFDTVVNVKRPQFKGSRDPVEGLLTDPWAKYLQARDDTLTAASVRVASVALASQAASIGATALPLVVGAGLHRITYYMRATTLEAGSTLTVTFSWIDLGVTCSWTSAALDTSAVANAQSGTLMVYTDQASAFTYATTYTAGGGLMRYLLRIAVEVVPA